MPALRALEILDETPLLWEIPTMIIADDKKRVRLPAVHPRDVYHPETLTRDLIVLRRVEPPKPKIKKRMTAAEIGRAIENSRIKFNVSYDELRKLTREP
jgi:hypothetical protein